jgi:hypothetical protein
MIKVDLQECEKGAWKIEKFTPTYTDFHALVHGRAVPVGETFTKLTRNGKLVMSDTPAEMDDHYMPVRFAKGHCLINGLGIGMVLKNILLNKEVTKITVIEISQDLIDLVSPFYKDSKIEFICADALEYQPPKGIKYGMVWHDIWDDICTDNLPEMEKLHRKYGRRCLWQGSWGKELCQRYLRSGY